jgi:hypothetical protein
MAGPDDLLGSAVETARAAYHKLVLLVGAPGSGKTHHLRSFASQSSLPYLNVNLSLSQRMLELTRGQRARKAEGLFEEMIAHAAEGGAVVLDNLELLFDATLQVDPLRLLQKVSRNTLVVASWNGTYQGGTLTYAEPHHPEYRSYGNVDAIVVSAAGTVTAGS